MAYLARDPERRLDPRLLDPRLRSVISLAYPYQPPRLPPIDWRQELRGRIAAYALGPDYHLYVAEKMRAVVGTLLRLRPSAVFRLYVDTGPVLEREWALRAGIGWIGKNTNLLNRSHGSYFFLGEIFTDVDFGDDLPPYRNYCGRCERCLNLCPTGALRSGYVMDARLCISYLTIELRGPNPRELRSKLGNWIFGCDVCQEVCPWNKVSKRAVETAWELMPFLPDLLRLDEGEFSRRFSRTALKRAKRRGLLRNVAVALGNSQNPRAIPALTSCLEQEKDALIRAHAAWALGRIGGAQAREALIRALAREPDKTVRQEIVLALEESGSCQANPI